jgi:hypothetical protein
MKKFVNSRDGTSKGAALIIVLAFVVLATAASVRGQSCPTSLGITFSGVTFDCPCTPSDEGLTTRRIVTQGNFNGYLGAFIKDNTNVLCPGTVCTYRVLACRTDVYPELVRFWEANPTATPACQGTPDPSQQFSSAVCNVFLIFTGSDYHLLAVDNYRGVIFYGTRTDLTGPFTNQAVSCNPTYTTWNNPAVICAFGAATNLTVIAHGGTATISP